MIYDLSVEDVLDMMSDILARVAEDQAGFDKVAGAVDALYNEFVGEGVFPVSEVNA